MYLSWIVWVKETNYLLRNNSFIVSISVIDDVTQEWTFPHLHKKYKGREGNFTCYFWLPKAYTAYSTNRGLQEQRMLAKGCEHSGPCLDGRHDMPSTWRRCPCSLDAGTVVMSSEWTCSLGVSIWNDGEIQDSPGPSLVVITIHMDYGGLILFNPI